MCESGIPVEAKARRGDLRLVPVTRSYTSVKTGQHLKIVYRLDLVTSVTREGLAQEGRSLLSEGQLFKGAVRGQMIIHQERTHPNGVDVVAVRREILARGDCEFESIEVAREFLGPFRWRMSAFEEEIFNT